MSKEVHRRGGCHEIHNRFQLLGPVLRQGPKYALVYLSVAGGTSRTLTRRVLRLLATV